MKQRSNNVRFFRASVPALGLGLVVLGLVAGGCTAGELADESVSEQTGALGPSTYDWLQFFGDGRHLGNNTLETELSQSTVSGLTQLFHVHPDAANYFEGPPVVLRSVNTAGGVRDLAFIETHKGTLYALDARTGVTVWSVTPPNPQTAKFTTTAPAIDPNKLFVYMYGFDGKVHKYNVANGTEVTGGGWPEVITLKPDIEKGITFLTHATDSSGATYLYMGTSGYGDFLDYQGHLTSINLATGAQKVFNAMCSNQTVHFVNTPGTPDCSMVHGAIWGRSTVVYNPTTNRIYGGTGDGTFDPVNHHWGDTVLGLNPDGSGSGLDPVDTYTPGIFSQLQVDDLDLGASSPTLLPNSGTKYPNIALQAGKDNVLRIINLSNLSNNAGGAGPGHTGGELWTSAVIDGTLNGAGHPTGTVDNAIVAWTNPADSSTWAFVPHQRVLLAYKLVLTAGDPSLALQWSLPNAVYPGSAIIVANNVLYRAYSTTSGTPGAGVIEARNPVTNAVLWSNNTGIGSIHWQSPVVANGIVYLADNAGFVTAFAIPTTSSPLPRTGWSATVGPNTSGEAPANMLDGVPSTRWATGTAQANNGNQWLRIDMGAVRTFNKITLDAGATADYPRGYTLSVSTDGITFNPLTSGVGTSALTTITFATQNLRYFKVTQTGTVTPNWWSVYELNVYGTGTAPLTAYARTGWTASAAYSNGADLPARTLDGNSATRWSDGKPQSTTPLPSPAPYYQVDMAVSQPFSQITLDSAGSTGDYLRNYQVLVGTVNPPTTVVASGTASAALTTISFPSVTARYVRVVQTAPSAGVGSWWSVAEFNVWH